jgi:hypothetical protein
MPAQQVSPQIVISKSKSALARLVFIVLGTRTDRTLGVPPSPTKPGLPEFGQFNICRKRAKPAAGWGGLGVGSLLWREASHNSPRPALRHSRCFAALGARTAAEGRLCPTPQGEGHRLSLSRTLIPIQLHPSSSRETFIRLQVWRLAQCFTSGIWQTSVTLRTRNTT